MGLGGGRFVVIPPEGALDKTVIVGEAREAKRGQDNVGEDTFHPGGIDHRGIGATPARRVGGGSAHSCTRAHRHRNSTTGNSDAHGSAIARRLRRGRNRLGAPIPDRRRPVAPPEGSRIPRNGGGCSP